ncbi:hypothetical protein [Paraburkholderia sp. CNPSo 3281]|uniref:hypothetical protein n=1 Tax=Paraburkholderia sp. CNPSo 3281 TaxID=2940933 RepID=UPI0020B653A0|nr:hypothetical protein [Paraburkholderia sp. CNPSo 3281]MCP3715493.1 hypothetical protein [Paraburkholderia sp. CNPSo 3281]
MTERLFRPGRVADESPEAATARKVGAIVATLAARTIACSGLHGSPLSPGVVPRLLGYFRGFSDAICTGWAVTGVGVSADASRFAISSVFPRMRECCMARVSDEVTASGTFRHGRTAGRTDGERYVTSGCSSTALREMLTADIPVACNTRFSIALPGCALDPECVSWFNPE